jgi:glycerate dehydrogenase
MQLSRPNIVITDGYTLNPGDSSWDRVAVLGNLTVYDRSTAEEVVSRCREADIVVVNKTPLTQELIASLPRLRFIAVSATGYDCVDVKAAGRRSIPVANVPEYGTNTVAQFVFSALLHMIQNISLHDRAVKDGEWSSSQDWCFWKKPTFELYGKTMGILGFGRIGRRVGELAHAFGMPVIAHDPSTGITPPYTPFAWVGLERLFEEADVLSVHAPRTADNERFINKELLRLMKPSAYLINTARGTLVNEEDLAKALDEGRLAGAALDVVSEEPIKPDNPLLKARNVTITPHMAWSTMEARRRLMDYTADNIHAFLQGDPINRVNGSWLSEHAAPQ